MEPIIIGIAGGSGSGKTTLAENLKKEFQNDIVMLSHDFYYKQHDELSFEERQNLNYDHPNAFDTDILIEHLKLLKHIIEKVKLLLLNPKKLLLLKVFLYLKIKN